MSIANRVRTLADFAPIEHRLGDDLIDALWIGKAFYKLGKRGAVIDQTDFDSVPRFLAACYELGRRDSVCLKFPTSGE